MVEKSAQLLLRPFTCPRHYRPTTSPGVNGRSWRSCTAEASRPSPRSWRSSPIRPTYSAVRSILRILSEKKLIEYKEDGPRYVYFPAAPTEDDARRRARARRPDVLRWLDRAGRHRASPDVGCRHAATVRLTDSATRSAARGSAGGKRTMPAIFSGVLRRDRFGRSLRAHDSRQGHGGAARRARRHPRNGAWLRDLAPPRVVRVTRRAAAHSGCSRRGVRSGWRFCPPRRSASCRSALRRSAAPPQPWRPSVRPRSRR